MAFKTKSEVVSKIEKDLDLEDEEFVQTQEMTDYINDAITIVEGHMDTMGLKDRYFYKTGYISLVTGTSDYALPSDLYEDKIKEVVYTNGATIYRMYLLDEDRSEEEVEHLNRFATTEYYRWRIINNSSTDKKFQIIPTSRETASNVVKLGYFRKLARVSADSDPVEVPEIALQWLYQYVKVMVYEKEAHENYPGAVAKLQAMEEIMLSTLRGQVADSGNTKIELDKTLYEEMS